MSRSCLRCLPCVCMRLRRSTPCLTGLYSLLCNYVLGTHTALPSRTMMCPLPKSEPIGENFVQVCTTTPCMLRGSTEILNTVCQHLGGIKPGDTTKDGKFTVIEVECQGACSNAPMVVVGDDFYEDLTPESTKKILDAFAKGEKPKPGPQSGRQTSENSAGLTALTSKVRSLQCINQRASFVEMILQLALRSWRTLHPRLQLM